jgi:hypothetical protein
MKGKSTNPYYQELAISNIGLLSFEFLVSITEPAGKSAFYLETAHFAILPQETFNFAFGIQSFSLDFNHVTLQIYIMESPDSLFFYLGGEACNPNIDFICHVNRL